MFSLLSPTRAIRKKLELTMERSKLYIDLGDKIDVPEYREIKRTEHGFTAVYFLPIGIHQTHIEKALAPISTAFNAEIEWHLIGRMLYMMFYTNQIPDSINFHDRFLTSHDVAPVLNIGFSRRGMESIYFDQVASPMMLVGGSTGYGKTSFIKSLITQLIKQDHQVFLGDPKLDYHVFRNHVTHQTEPDEIKEMVQYVASAVKNRQKFIVEKCGYENIVQYNQATETKMEYIFLIVDEILDFPTDDEMFWDPLAEIARKGRSAGVYCISSVQRASADMFPKIVRNNMAIRLCLKMEEETDSALVLGNEAAFHLPPLPGRAILRQNRQVELQVPYISKEQIEAILYGAKE